MEEFFLSGGIPSPLHFKTTPSLHPASSSAIEVQPWGESTDHFSHFESALSSMVSLPAPTHTVGDDSVNRALTIGKLGDICHPAPNLMNFHPSLDHFVKEILPSLEDSNPRNPLVPEVSGDPGFAERAAKYSCFGSSRSFNCRTAQLSLSKFDSISNPSIHRVSSTPPSSSSSLLNIAGRFPASQQDEEMDRMPGGGGCERLLCRLSSNGSSPRSHAELGNSQEESSVSEQILPTGDLNSRKRKAVSSRECKAKDIASSSNNKAQQTQKKKKIDEDDDSNGKRSKTVEGKEKDDGIGKCEEEAKPPEPPKDYIHVRARRGQATDSHSLAERVRREKISERMKLLQDLIPGCNKVTGKALMLDEIINYVQSLQRQVECLSMKLASIDFRPDAKTLENGLQEEKMYQSSSVLAHHQVYQPLDSSATATATATFYGQQHPNAPSVTRCSVDPVSDKTLCRNHSMQLPLLSGFVDDESLPPQLPTMIHHDDLQSIVRMGYGTTENHTFGSI